MKTIDEYNAEQEQIAHLKRLEAAAMEPDPCQPPEEPARESRYKRGRRWWEQSRWERKR